MNAAHFREGGEGSYDFQGEWRGNRCHQQTIKGNIEN